MEKGAKYSAIALGFLVVASSVVYISYLTSVSASPVESVPPPVESQQDRSVPLKVGWNLVAGASLPITKESKIIMVGEGRIVSIADARQMGVIGDIVVGQDNILGRDFDEIPPREEFYIYIGDLSVPVSIIF